MPVNPKHDFILARRKYTEARTTNEKLKALYEMLRTAPKHKSSEKLLADIKSKIAKYKRVEEKETSQRRGYTRFSIKKEGAATVCLVGTTNSGKSTLLSTITNAKPEISQYQFTTNKPEIGTMDYSGIKIQVIEIPSITKDFRDTKNGPAFLSIARSADLIILMFKGESEKELLEEELYDVEVPRLIVKGDGDIKDAIWKRLNLIKVYTKMPGKERDFPPIALKRGSTVRDLAANVHKDFIKKFKFARIWGNSVKYNTQRVSLNHSLEDDDIVELHTK